MKCLDNCGYFWKEDDEKYPCCHCPSDIPWPAPCAIDESEEDDWSEDDNIDYDEADYGDFE